MSEIYASGNWVSIDDDKTEKRKELDSFIIECLGCANLLVLTGTGSSWKVDGFVGMAALWNEIDKYPELKDVTNLVKYPQADKNIEHLLSRCKMAVELGIDNNNQIADFVKKTENMIVEKCAFVKPATVLDDHEAFISKIAKRGGRKPRTKIFTTNYDRCFEQAASNRKFVVIDGFSHHNPPVYDPSYFSYDIVRRSASGETPDYIDNVFHLYKLHGSVDWNGDEEITKTEKPTYPVLIYPRSNKYEMAFRSPYIEMMASFQTILRQPDTALIVVGFGFNDNHISEPIFSALKSNLDLRLLVCDPSIKGSKNDYHQIFKKFIDEGDTRIGLLNATFKELVKIIPDMARESERERHEKRLQRLNISINQQQAGASNVP